MGASALQSSVCLTVRRRDRACEISESERGSPRRLLRHFSNIMIVAGGFGFTAASLAGQPAGLRRRRTNRAAWISVTSFISRREGHGDDEIRVVGGARYPSHRQ